MTGWFTVETIENDPKVEVDEGIIKATGNARLMDGE